MKVLAIVLLQILIPVSCRVMLYDILSAGQDNVDTNKQASHHQQR